MTPSRIGRMAWDVAGVPADHLASLFADRHDVVLVVDSDHGGLLHHDAVALT